jgi:hypothetical protein
MGVAWLRRGCLRGVRRARHPSWNGPRCHCAANLRISTRAEPAGAQSLEARTVVAVSMLKDDELVGEIVIYRQESASVLREADRTGDELRQPGGDSDREHPSAQ